MMVKIHESYLTWWTRVYQFNDDTILFMDQNLEQAKNMKLLLRMFEQLSGLKINFHKSEIFCFSEAKNHEHEYTVLFGCGMGPYPFIYLGIPMHFHKIRNSDWSVIEDRFKHKQSTWKAKHLSYDGRLFFWHGSSDKQKYCLAKWDIMCRPKDQGELGITNLNIKNKSLLSKWLFKLLNEDGVWQTIHRNKYLTSKCLSQVQIKLGDSHFWKGILKVGTKPLKDQFSSLYNIVNYTQKAVADVMIQMPPNITFRRALSGDKLTVWHKLVAKIANFHLSIGRDIFTWSLHRHSQFSV
ncbi:LOW QUALITY PROTEIN: hypothetical protein U9M48_028772, partial [Paspalum notatum var. saurae]